MALPSGSIVVVPPGPMRLSNLAGRSTMLKIVTAAATALYVTVCPLAYAQNSPLTIPDRLSAADWNKLTDLRLDLIKATLQLTPDQTKYWPSVENAIRARAQNRQARLSKVAETASKWANVSSVDIMRNRDPIAFLNRRADALAERSADLKKLSEAWQPLYQTLSPEQKKRMAALAIFVLHEMSEDADQLRAQADDDN
jgi:LTXXQ motif family protein